MIVEITGQLNALEGDFTKLNFWPFPDRDWRATSHSGHYGNWVGSITEVAKNHVDDQALTGDRRGLFLVDKISLIGA